VNEAKSGFDGSCALVVYNRGSPAPWDPCRDEMSHDMTKGGHPWSGERSPQISTTETQMREPFGGHSAQTYRTPEQRRPSTIV